MNLWAFYDSSIGFVYALSGKAYNVDGSQSEKLALLARLAASDYITAKRYELPDRFQVDLGGGDVVRAAPASLVTDPSAQMFAEQFKTIEAELPPLRSGSVADVRPVPQMLPESPLCAVTILHEEESGAIRPIITDQDAEWFAEQQRARHNRIM